MPQSVESTEPKKGSAMDRMRERMQTRLNKQGQQSPVTQTPEPTGEVTPTPSTSGAEPSGAEPPATSSAPSPKPAETTPPKKMTLGQALDKYKTRNKELEAELAEWKTKAGNVDAKGLTEERDRLQSRNKELEEEIRYVNYQKSEEFTSKYQIPYRKAWDRAMEDLKEVRIQLQDGQEREVTGNDILELCNMPLSKAREVARAVFGDFADDVMQHRKEIKRLFDEQSQALTEARTNGEAREKQRNEQFQKLTGEIDGYIKTNWEKANAEAHGDAKYGAFFKPIEGDAEGNQRLAKGFELVDRAFAENPKDPRLNAEQRLAIIKRHAAVRNRAAGFGRLAWQNEKLKAELAAANKKLGEYEGTIPAAGGGNGAPASTNGGSLSAWDRVRSGMNKYAH